MSGGGKINHRFSADLRKYELARKPGTDEARKRADYPGAAARDYVCNDTGCLNFAKATDHTTWFLCNACGDLAPDVVTYYTHAPYKVLPTASKRHQANCAAFSAWAKYRKRSET